MHVSSLSLLRIGSVTQSLIIQVARGRSVTSVWNLSCYACSYGIVKENNSHPTSVVTSSVSNITEGSM
jgi:hypothetical protein